MTVCGRGGTGRRATLRSLWANARGSSSLLDRTKLLNLLRSGAGPHGNQAVLDIVLIGVLVATRQIAIVIIATVETADIEILVPM